MKTFNVYVDNSRGVYYTCKECGCVLQTMSLKSGRVELWCGIDTCSNYNRVGVIILPEIVLVDKSETEYLDALQSTGL